MKKFKIEATWFNDAYIVVEVDEAILTDELATMINEFWSDADMRLDDENGNVRNTVIRLFGAMAINWFMENGGADCHSRDNYWTERVLDGAEGWPKEVANLGIRLTEISVNTPSFDDCEIEEV